MVEHTYLCVGGPLAGKRHEELKHNNFTAVVQKPQYATFDPKNMPPNAKVASIERIQYHLEIFHSPDGDISIWVPYGQSLLDTMKMLLEAYARDQKIQNELEWER